jgi:AraC family transcriptional regulator of adaptative response / DNA-3-methyladenine glycosylase II
MACGYESLSGFYEQFRRFTCVTPGEYRHLTRKRAFRMSWPERFNVGLWRSYLDRDPDSACERLEGDSYLAAVEVDRQQTLIRLRFDDGGISVSADGDLFAVHGVVCRLLGCMQDLDGFRSIMLAESRYANLLPDGVPLRIPQTVSVWDGLVWAILGQQVNVMFAARLRSRLARFAGTAVDEGLFTLPSPSRMADLMPADLAPLQFSARKSEYLIGLGRAVAKGECDVEGLPEAPATYAERVLLSQRGIGPWAANYIMMRACGFMDATPIGDTGLGSGLQRCFGLKERPDSQKTEELMKNFAPYRSLATYHLWLSLGEAE